MLCSYNLFIFFSQGYRSIDAAMQTNTSISQFGDTNTHKGKDMGWAIVGCVVGTTKIFFEAKHLILRVACVVRGVFAFSEKPPDAMIS